MPKSRADWEVLAAIYNKKKSFEMTPRDAISLKRRVRSLRARPEREVFANAQRPSGLACWTASVSQRFPPSGKCWQQVKRTQEVSGGHNNAANASAQPHDIGNPRANTRLSSLSEPNDVKCALDARSDHLAHEVLALTQRRLSKIRRAHRRAGRRLCEEMREYIASLTDMIT
ncbi:hypothetical protein DVH05_027332 [Phytophthora capsici]|nr:hypothetical protein DVH05_027332 [Phytophthora capsici]